MTKIPTNIDFVYLLFGKTGVGKSATGNSILGQDVYKTSDSGVSETSEVEISFSIHCDVNVCVIDTPGAMDTDDTLEQSKYRLCQQMAEAVKNIPEKTKTIILLVLKYPDRYTEENLNVIHIFKHLFGNNVLAESCVIIFTGGDNFKRKDKTFLTWCKEQNKELQTVLCENNYTCLLFDNENQECRQKQNQELIRVSRSIKLTDCLARFLKAERGRRRLILESKLPNLKTDFQKKIIRFENQLQTIMQSSVLDLNSNTNIKILQDEIKETLRGLELEDDAKLIFYEENEQQLLNPFMIRFQKLNENLNDFLKRTARQNEKIVIEKNLFNLKYDIDKAIYTSPQIKKEISKFGKKLKKIKNQLKEQEKSNPYLGCLKSDIHRVEVALLELESKVTFHSFINKIEKHVRILENEVSSFKEIPSKEKIEELQRKCEHQLKKVTIDNRKEEMKELNTRLQELHIRLSYLEKERILEQVGSPVINVLTEVGALFFPPLAFVAASIALTSRIRRFYHRRRLSKEMSQAVQNVTKNEKASCIDNDNKDE